MRRLVLLLLFAFASFACASYAYKRTIGTLVVQNRAWNDVTVYSEPVGRPLGRCSLNQTCRLKLRSTDFHQGLLEVSYREMTWDRDRRVYLPAVDGFYRWELVVGHLPQFSYIRPAEGSG